MSELIGDVAATAVKIGSKGVFATVLGAAPWLPLAVAGISLAAGGFGTVWYRMQWKACEAAGKQALIDQREIDRRDNSVAVAHLTGKLNQNERTYDKAMDTLASIPKNNACERDARVRAAREQLCAKYPASEACNRQIPSR